MGARPVALLNSLRFGPLDVAAEPLSLRRRRPRRRRLRQLRRRADARAARSGFASGYTGNPLVNAMCVGLLARGGSDPRRRRGRRQRAARRRRPDRTGRHSRRELRLRGAVGAERGPAAAGSGGRSVHRKASARGQPRADHLRPHRRDPGHGRRRSHQLQRRDGGARRRGRGDRHRPGPDPRGRDDAVRDPALGIAGADAGRGHAGAGGGRAGGLRAVGAVGHADRPGDRRRDVPGEAPRASRWRRFPGQRLVDDCPIYHPEASESAEAVARRAAVPPLPPTVDLDRALDGHPRQPERREQALGVRAVRLDACRLPPCSDPGGDAGVLRVPGTEFGLAVTVDCNAGYVALDPYEGGKAAVAEAARNVACTGARPLGITDCLNFGNPEKPEVFFQFREACRGIADACLAFGTPVTGGNVSFYNESPTGAIDPTPTIGMVGLLADVERRVPSYFAAAGDDVCVVGDTRGELGGSAYWSEIRGFVGGPPPPVDLDAERRLQRFLVEAAERAPAALGPRRVARAGCWWRSRRRRSAGPMPRAGLGARLDLEALRRRRGARRRSCTARTPDAVVLSSTPDQSGRRGGAGARRTAYRCFRAGTVGGSAVELRAGVSRVHLGRGHIATDLLRGDPSADAARRRGALGGRIDGMCGIIGVSGIPDAARLTYLGLYALQHRGQESAGIVAIDRDGMRPRASRHGPRLGDLRRATCSTAAAATSRWATPATPPPAARCWPTPSRAASTPAAAPSPSPTTAT